MSNNNTMKSYEEQIKSNTRNLIMLKEQRKRDCKHKPSDNAHLIGIRESKANIPNKKDLPDSTVVCTKCEKYFESSSYTPDEIESGLYMFCSIPEQIKLNAQLSKEDESMIEEYYAALDTITNVCNFYNNMVEKLANGGGNKKRANRSNKGHMGINSGMFSGRQF